MQSYIHVSPVNHKNETSNYENQTRSFKYLICCMEWSLLKLISGSN